MTDPVLSPEIRPEWIEAAKAVAFTSMRSDPRVWHEALDKAVELALITTVPLIAAAARAEALRDVIVGVEGLRGSGSFLGLDYVLWSDALAAIRSLIPEATE